MSFDASAPASASATIPDMSSAASAIGDEETIQPAYVLSTDQRQFNTPLCVALHPIDPNTIAVSYFDRTIKLWNVPEKKTKANFSCTPTELNKYNYYGGVRESSRARLIAWHPNGGYLVAGCDDRSVKICHIGSQEPVHELLHDGFGPLTSVEFSMDGSKLLVAGAKANMRIYNTENYSTLAQPNLLKVLAKQLLVNLGCAAFVPDGSAILFANGNNLYKLNTSLNGKTDIVEHTSPVLCVKCKENKIISGSKTDLILREGGGIAKRDDIGAVAISFNNEGTLVAVIDEKDDTVKILNSTTGDVYHSFSGSIGWNISWVGPRIAYCKREHVQTLVVNNTKELLDTVLEEIDLKLSGKQLPSDLGFEVLKYLGTPSRQIRGIGKYLTSESANPSPPPRESLLSAKMLPPPPRESLLSEQMLPPPPPESLMSPPESLLSPPVKSRRLGENTESPSDTQIPPSEYNQITPESNKRGRGGTGGKTKRKIRSKTTKKLIAKNLKKRSLKRKRK
jgi:hypothetical protein